MSDVSFRTAPPIGGLSCFSTRVLHWVTGRMGSQVWLRVQGPLPIPVGTGRVEKCTTGRVRMHIVVHAQKNAHL